MTVEYRLARIEDMPSVMWAQSVAFGGSTATSEIEGSIERTLIRPEWRLCAFDGGECVAQVVVVPVTMHWNGRAVAAAGVTDVFTLPTHRRRGHLRELMTWAYRLMREAGQCVTILEASMAAIYQRFGWSVVYTGLMHDFDPRHLRFVDDVPVPGRVRLVRRDEARAVIEPVYERYASARMLPMRRGDFEWSAALRLKNTTRAPFLVAVYEEADAVLGYTIYDVGTMTDRPMGEPDQQITTQEWVWLTPGAHRGLIQYLSSHDLVGSVRMWGIPLDDPLTYQVEEPRALKVRAYDGALARIVDVQAALAERGYDRNGRLVLGIEDTYAPWNSGVWELTVDGAAAVRCVSAEPQIRLTPRVLALMVSGFQPASVLARAGLIECADPAAVAVADDLFRTARVPVCLDHWM
ncbi:MAG: enhanced intracellular survival protein Eis [Dehalococcoidia bacterium]